MEAKQVISTNQYFYFNDILQTYKAISEQAFADISKMEVIDFESSFMKGLEKLMMISEPFGITHLVDVTNYSLIILKTKMYRKTYNQ